MNSTLLLDIFNLSLACSIPILLVLLLTPLLDRRYTAKLRYWVWLALGIRLVLPFQLPLTSLFTQTIAPMAVQDIPVVALPQQPTNPVNFEEIAPAAGGATAPEIVASANAASITLFDILLLIWIAGILVVLLRHVYTALRLRRHLRRWGTPCTDVSVLECVARTRKEKHMRRPVRVVISNIAESPFTTGLFRPILVLPEHFCQDNLNWVVQHELVHIKRFDLAYKLSLSFVTAMHWFNPLVWQMCRMAGKDLELICDEQVIRGTGRLQRTAYSEAILQQVCTKRSALSSASTGFSADAKFLKERFQHIMNPNKKRRGLPILITILLCIVFVGSLAACKLESQAERKNTPSIATDSSTAESRTPNVETRPNATGAAYMVPLADYQIDRTYSSEHPAIDFTGAENASIFATAGGTVITAEFASNYGYYVIIDHGNGITSLYAHCASLSVQAGDTVAQGTAIAEVGSTGQSTAPHLHFEMLQDGVNIDPAPLLGL